MAEGTSLLRMHTAYTCIVGSNPTVSAKNDEKSHRKVAFFFGALSACDLEQPGSGLTFGHGLSVRHF